MVATLSQHEMLIPVNTHAEKNTIGGVLLNPDLFMGIATLLHVDDFYHRQHQIIWESMTRLSQQGQRIEMTSVAGMLTELNQLEEIGGMPTIIELINTSGDTLEVDVHAQMVKRASTRRHLMRTADDIHKLAQDAQRDLSDILKESESKLFDISDTYVEGRFIPIAEAVSEYYEAIEYRLSQPGGSYGVPSGFKKLDQLLGGFQKSDLVVFAGRPGMGKTSFLLTAALHAAEMGVRIAIFTMEMGTEQIVQRIISMNSGISVQSLRLGQINENENQRLFQAMGRVSELQIFIDDTPALSPIDMKNRVRRLKHEYGVDIVIIDYMQLMTAGNRKLEGNRVQEITYISRMLKEMAREFNIPVISAAQLSRAVEQRQDKRPQLSDLRESGSIEQDSDIVMFLYRDVVYNAATESPSKAEVIVAKHRNGPTDTVELHFDGRLTKFTDLNLYSVDLSGN